MPLTVFQIASRPLVLALLISLLAHLLMLFSAGNLWSGMRAEIDFPIEARLTAAPMAPDRTPSVDPAPRPRPTSRPAPEDATPPRASTPSSTPPAPPLAEPVESLPGAQPVVEPAPEAPSAQQVAPARAENPVAPTTARPPPLLRRAQRSLPRQLEIDYAIAVGDEGFVAGQAIYRWHARDGRYSLVSTAEAQGLAALFIQGRIVQVSEGVLDEHGLWPEQFQMRRNAKQDSARFDWAQQRLVHGDNRGTFDLTPQAQDVLSFPFHLALVAQPDDGAFNLGVTNGRKFRDYAFSNLGREPLTVQGKTLETLHLQGRREGEAGSLDVWLDLSRSGLPVKVRTFDNKGKVFVLHLQGVKVQP